eukprot:CAMPEP_0172659876 /NCGR_PEP_ID=MMETSP1074-20121228/3746_1 /TAXON_ID=2916 /ORGANISM="Ceratium fusus, Strain PA161109" /LENGTH=80 /DNA_ID=CAMNT_0013475447 /DNA_START=333 /DNA_END=575 /DNA_ORIENTATION=+
MSGHESASAQPQPLAILKNAADNGRPVGYKAHMLPVIEAHAPPTLQALIPCWQPDNAYTRLADKPCQCIILSVQAAPLKL